MRIVLASESPARRRALNILGVPYEIRPSGLDEKAIRSNDPSTLVRLLSEAKAKKVAEVVHEAIIVAGDAVAASDNIIYEKPSDGGEAVRFLAGFSGRTIDYVTGIAVLNSASGKMLSSVQRSKISFRNLHPLEITDYVERNQVLTFAGAFDGDGVMRFAESVSGACNFMAGLAISELVVLMRQHGVSV